MNKDGGTIYGGLPLKVCISGTEVYLPALPEAELLIATCAPSNSRDSAHHNVIQP